jgi:single-stranded-DNA-specific exonuclease RecJ
VPGRHGRELEERAAAARVPVAELGILVVPRHLEQILLDALVEPRAAEDQLAEPVDEGLVAYEGDPLPMPHEVVAERASRLFDDAVGSQLHEVAGLVRLELAGLDQSEPDRGRIDALLEVDRVEREAVPEELDDVVIAREIVRLGHPLRITSDPGRSVVSMHEGTWTIRPCPRAEVAELVTALEVSEVTASVLVRRGYGDPEQARAFLAAAGPGHDPLLLGDVAAARELVRGAIAAGKRICVHGDYDVDGICATALAVASLRELGADVGWHLPSRFEEGYGVSSGTLARLVEEGCGLVLTADCGISAVEEIADARAAGLEVVVTDHHRPGETLPDCPVVATRPSSYPFPDLCGTGVVYKFLLALGADGLERHLDLVALATVADVVPLVDENRAFVAEGLRRLARTGKPGLQALMRAARVDPAAVDTGAIGFRLAPRINAAGRLGHPATALELLLTEDSRKAERLAGELETLNRDRQGVEERILREAVEAVEDPAAAAHVLHAEHWHRGVIGIVASRLAERLFRPVVLIAGGEDEWVGSGRSIPAFDLHASFAATAEHLGRWGGHRAAAGLSIRPDRIPAFRDAFVAYAGENLSIEDLDPVTVVDAAVDARDLTLSLCEELRRLEPFGLGNPSVRLLVAGCEFGHLAAVGEGGKHLQVGLTSNGRPLPRGIAFGRGGHLDRYRRPELHDVVFKLAVDRWNGVESPQVIVDRIFETAEGYATLRSRLLEEWQKSPGSWSDEARAIFEELGLQPGGWRSPMESPTFRAALSEPFPQAA